jgi:hypothetical protein
MYENIIALAGIGLLFILCLPLPGVQRVFLAIYGLALRLGMLALVAAAAYLWFVPSQLPTVVADAVRNTPLLKSILPEPGTAIFTICAVSLIAVAVLPMIAVIDISRRAVGRRENLVVSEPVRVDATRVISRDLPAPAPYAQDLTPSRFGRRAAANAFASVGSTS